MKPHPLLKSTASTLTLVALILLALPLAGRADTDVDLSSTAWHFSNGAEYKGADGKSEYSADDKTLTLSYDFTKGGQYVADTLSLSEIDNVSGLKINVTGPGGNLTIALVDTTGQTLLYRLAQIEDGPHTLNVNLPEPSACFGGPKDKTPHYPFRSIRLTVEKGHLLTGKLVFSGITFVTSAPSQ